MPSPVERGHSTNQPNGGEGRKEEISEEPISLVARIADMSQGLQVRSNRALEAMKSSFCSSSTQPSLP